MIKSFINRQEELHSMEKEYSRNEASLYVLYGRRRLGKTRLIQEFITNKPSIYFMASEELERENLLRFRDKVADFTKNDLLKQEQNLPGKWYFNN